MLLAVLMSAVCAALLSPADVPKFVLPLRCVFWSAVRRAGSRVNASARCASRVAIRRRTGIVIASSWSDQPASKRNVVRPDVSF